MQYLSEPELSALNMAMHQISQRQLPLVLVGAGLPQLVALAGSSKNYAERLFQYPQIGPLLPVEAAEGLQEPVQQQGVEPQHRVQAFLADSFAVGARKFVDLVIRYGFWGPPLYLVAAI